jgi:hypothetical protein
MHSQVTQPGPRGAWRGTDRSGGSRGPPFSYIAYSWSIPRSFMAATICSDSASCTRDRSRLGATRTEILMSSTFDSGERDHGKSLSSPTRLCSPPSWTCTAARGCASGGDWFPRRSGSPTAATCAFGERKGEPRLGSVPTRRPGRRTAQDFVLVRTPPGGTNTASVARPQRQALSYSPVNSPIGGRGRVF